MCSNPLQLTIDKTEVLWCASARQQSQLSRCPVLIFGASVEPVSAVRDLGVFVDRDLGAATHVRRIVSRCFAVLRQLRHLRRHVTNNCFRSLAVSLVYSRPEYGNLIPVGLPACLQRRRYDHVTDDLAMLHWLRLLERVNFKLALMAYRVLRGMVPANLIQLVPV